MSISTPVSKSIDEIHEKLTDLINTFNLLTSDGLAIVGKTSEQINKLTDTVHLGKIIYNSTTGKLSTSYLDNGLLKWRDV